MSIYDDGFGPYTIGPDGEKQYGDSTSAQINGENLYLFDSKTGVLQFSANEAAIARIAEGCGSFPIKELAFNFGNFGTARFHNVTAITPLPRADGTFFLDI